MALLRILAAVLAVIAALTAFGWGLDPSVSRAVGLLAVAFACYVVAAFTPPLRIGDR